MSIKYDAWGNDTGNKYAAYQLYREKQKAGYFEDEELVSVEEYEYQIGKRDHKIEQLQQELDSLRNFRSELDKIKNVLYMAGVIHSRDEIVCLSDKISWLLERQTYRLNEFGLQVDD